MNEVEILPAPSVVTRPSRDPRWERERKAFRRLLPELLKTHANQYVAVYQEKVAESGDDLVEVALRAYRRLGYVPIYVDQVLNKPAAPVRIPSPRLSAEA